MGHNVPSDNDPDNHIIKTEDKKVSMIANFIQLCDSCYIDIHQEDIVSSVIVKVSGSDISDTLTVEIRRKQCKISIYSQRVKFKDIC